MPAHDPFDKLPNISDIWKLCPGSGVATTASFVEHVLPSVVDVASQAEGRNLEPGPLPTRKHLNLPLDPSSDLYTTNQGMLPRSLGGMYHNCHILSYIIAIYAIYIYLFIHIS